MVELILYIGLLSIMLVLLTSLFSTSIDLQLESRSTSTLDQDTRFIMTRLGYDVNRATNISTPTLGTTDTSITLVIGGENFVYSVQNGNLILTTPGGTQQLNGYDTTVASVSFQRLGNASGKNSVQMILTLNSRTQLTKGTESKTITTTFTTR